MRRIRANLKESFLVFFLCESNDADMITVYIPVPLSTELRKVATKLLERSS